MSDRYGPFKQNASEEALVTDLSATKSMLGLVGSDIQGCSLRCSKFPETIVPQRILIEVEDDHR